ncbi:putative reverse transcriptase domain-containing protein [Tanacetum coccineum]
MSAPIVEEEIVEPAGEDPSDSSGTRDGIVRSFKDMPIDLNDDVRNFYHHMSEVRIDRIVGIETVQRQTMTNTRSGMTHAVIEEMINQRVDAALEARRVNRDLELGNGNGDRHVAHKCTYQDFMKCQPMGFKGIEGVVGLIRWSEKIETLFHISNCPERYQVKYATCTLLDSALTWWNSHKRTIRTDVAYTLSWRELLKPMTEVYCLRNEIQNMETELWNLLLKNNDMANYTQRF